MDISNGADCVGRIGRAALRRQMQLAHDDLLACGGNVNRLRDLYERGCEMNSDDVTERILGCAYVVSIGIVFALAIYVLALGGYCFCRHIWTMAFPQTPTESEVAG